MNLPELEELLDNYHKMTGLDIAIVDKDFRVLVRRHSGNEFCTYIHKNPRCLEMCLASDNIQLHKVNEEKKLVIYTCPFGILEAITPIMQKGDVIAYLFLSMGVEDEFSRGRIIEKVHTVADNLDYDLLLKYIDKIPDKSIGEFNASASMLPIIAGYIENNNMISDPRQTIGQMIKAYVKDNLNQKITLSDLSYSLHCSTVTLTTHFKQEFGMTIMDYVMDKRMYLAEKLLLENSYSVREIAEMCGFSDSEYFSRCFKSKHGVSPLGWKSGNINN